MYDRVPRLLILVGLFYSPTVARPCSKGELPPIDLSTLEAALQTEILESLDDTGGVWTELGPMPVANSEFSVVEANGRFYSVGGFLAPNQSKLLIFDPKAAAWTEGQPLPQPTHHAGVVSLDGKVFAIGGSLAETTVQIYDPVTDSWSFGSQMPTPRAAPAAVVSGGKIHIIGGVNNISIGAAKQAHEVYDPAANSWEVRADLPLAAEHVSAQKLGDTIYVAGGRDAFVNRGNVWAYDADRDAWDAAQGLSSTSGYASAALAGKMYVFGGEDLLSGIVSARSLAYDPESNSWQGLEPLPVPLHGVAGAGLGTSIFVFGGSRVAGSGVGENRVYRFDPPDVPELGGVPRRPRRLKAKALSATEVRLKWKDKSKDETSFEIEASVAGGAFVEFARAEANTRKLVLEGLTPATTYVFRVRARNAAGVSDYSNERVATTPGS